MDINSEVAYNANLGINAIDSIKEYIGDEELKNAALSQRARLCDFKDKAVRNISDDRSDARPAETKKGMLSGAVKMKAMMDKSNNNLSKMLIEGYNTGINQIIEKSHDLKDNGRYNSPLVGELIEIYDEGIKQLRQYL